MANNVYEENGQWCVEDDLQNGVNGDQDCAILIVAASETSPDQNLWSMGQPRRSTGVIDDLDSPLQYSVPVLQGQGLPGGQVHRAGKPKPGQAADEISVLSIGNGSLRHIP